MTVFKEGKYDSAAKALGKWLKERSDENWKAFCIELYDQIELKCRYNKLSDNIEPSELAGEVMEKLLEDFAIKSHDACLAPENLPKKVGKKPRVRITKDFFLANHASDYDSLQSVAYVLNWAEFLIIEFKKKKDKSPKRSIKGLVREALNELLKQGIIFEKICKPKKSTNVFRASFFKNNPDFHDGDTLIKPLEKISPEAKIWFKSNYRPHEKCRVKVAFLEDFFHQLFGFLGKDEKYFNQDLGDFVYELMGRPEVKTVHFVEGLKEVSAIEESEPEPECFRLLRICPDEKTIHEANRKFNVFLQHKPKLDQLKSFLVNSCLVCPEELLVELGIPPAFIIRLRDLKVGTHKSPKTDSPIQSQKIGIFLNIKRNLAFTQVTVISEALENFRKELEVKKIDWLMFRKAFLKVLITEFKGRGFFSSNSEKTVALG